MKINKTFKVSPKTYFILNIIFTIVGAITLIFPLGLLGFCVFYTNTISLELPFYFLLIYLAFACVVLAKYTVYSVRNIKNLKNNINTMEAIG